MARPPDATRTSPLALPSPSSPLLRLSPHIRQRIYRHLGLASWGRPHQFFLHAGQLKLRHARQRYEYWHFVPDPNSFHGLLLSCRAIHAEAAALLYSANQFILYYPEPPADPGRQTSFRPLHTLHALTAPSLRSLWNLKIILNEAACHQLTLTDYAKICCLEDRDNDDWGLPWCKQKHGGLHQHPLLSPASGGDDDHKLAAARTVLSEWHTAATRLLSHITPGRLTLSLVCDIDPQHPQAIDTATSVLQPLLLLPPSYLKECHIRLAKTTDPRLQQLAQDTVLHTCGLQTPYSEPPSRAASTTLASLPRELRIRILEYTDLITPRRQVIWSREGRAYIVFHFRTDSDGHLDDQYSNQFSQCWNDWRGYDGDPLTNGCFCRRRHAAFSPVCKCWTPPGPTLFLICRTLYEDAQFVFFSGNRFILHDQTLWLPWSLPLAEEPEDGPAPTYPYPNERFIASEFLRDVIPTRSLAYLRFLELVFPPYRPPSWPQTQHPAMQDWWSTVDWLQDKINPLGLTIRLIVADADDGASPSYYHTITTEARGMVTTAYMDLLRPLTRLADRGLARFYAHFAYPWTEESRIRRLDDPYLELDEKKALKEHAERYVLGHRYESIYANGREEPKPSDWDMLYY